MRYLFLLFLFLCAACVRDAGNPMCLAPSTPYSTWTPLKGNRMVSSQFCEMLIPSTFGACELSLAELIDIALQNNPSTKQTWAQARAAASQYGESLSPFFPNLDFNCFYFRQYAAFPQPAPTTPGAAPQIVTSTSGTTTAVTPSFFTEAGPDITLTYTLFDFGQRTAAAQAARESLYYADLNHNQQIQTILQTVMYDYYTYVYQMAVLKANEASFANAQSALDAANERFSLGLAALGDVAQARTQYLQNKMAVTSQKQNVENAFAQLASDLGLPANIPFKVQPFPEQVIADPILTEVDELLSLAQNQRQDFRALQANLRSKEAALLQAQRSTYPVFQTNLDVGKYWFSEGLTDHHHWSATLSVNFPIFNGFLSRNQVRTAQANVELSRAQLLEKELNVIQNVTTAHMNIKTSALNLTDSNEYLKAAELEFNIALANYKMGTMTILDVLSAQSSLADARSKKAGAQKDWFVSLANLAYATGSLCATPNEQDGQDE